MDTKTGETMAQRQVCWFSYITFLWESVEWIHLALDWDRFGTL
jgi:hypothetical protein